MSTFRLTVAYDGTDYAGWQRQAGVDTIQAHLESAISEIEGTPVAVHGAGRTDAGVHALGQVASVGLTRRIGGATLARAVNAKLPHDIRVLRADAVPDQFHARFGARSKTYRYRVLCASVSNPLEARYAWQTRAPLDVAAMRQGAATLIGTHDFAAFHTAAAEEPWRSTVRTIFDLTVGASSPPAWLCAEGMSITIEVVGNGFLRHMVRTIVGTLVQVGRGRWASEKLREVVASRNRSEAGPTAPAHGLYLVGVDYAEA